MQTSFKNSTVDSYLFKVDFVASSYILFYSISMASIAMSFLLFLFCGEDASSTLAHAVRQAWEQLVPFLYYRWSKRMHIGQSWHPI